MEPRGGTARWFKIGRDRFESEINLEKVLRTLRNLKILSLSNKYVKAKLVLDKANTIEVDSEDIKSNQKNLEIKQ